MNNLEDRPVIIQKVRQWGGSASSAILEPTCMYFRDPNIDGLIAYKNFSNCAVVIGDPVCDPAHHEALASSFHDYCQQKNQRIIYLTASEPFARWGYQKLQGALIQFGHEIILDPQSDPRERHGVHASLVRRKVRHAEHDGVTILEYKEHDPQLEKQLRELGYRWVKQRRGHQIYLSHVRLFEDRQGKRWLYASHQGRPVGVLMLNKLESRQGWLLNHLMLSNDAPHGTPELLVIKALEILKQEGCHFVTCGFVPSTKVIEVTGLGSYSSWLTKQAYWIAKKLFHLEGRAKFWEKFEPQQANSFLLLSRPSIGIQEINALMHAMNAS